MIRIILFLFVLLGITFMIYQLISYMKYRSSVYFKIDQDVQKLDDEIQRYQQEVEHFKMTKTALHSSYLGIKQPPEDVRELYELRSAVLEKEINLYKKIIKLYEQYKEALVDKKQVLKFKEKHGNRGEPAEDISDALFKVKEMRAEIKTNLKISYYDQLSGSNELTDLRGSLKHLEEIEAKDTLQENETQEHLELDIQDDFLMLKELVRQKL